MLLVKNVLVYKFVKCKTVINHSTCCQPNRLTLLCLPLQKNGVEKNLGLGKLTDFEVDLIKAAMPELKKNIQKGEEFANAS